MLRQGATPLRLSYTCLLPDTSYESSSDCGAHFDPSWRRSSVQLSQQSVGGATASGDTAASRIKNLLRGISIKPAKITTKISKRRQQPSASSASEQPSQQPQHPRTASPLHQQQQRTVMAAPPLPVTAASSEATRMDTSQARTAQSQESLLLAAGKMNLENPLPFSIRHDDGLQKINRPDLENLRHRENSLKLWIFEAKRLPSTKKRYYCEISLDHILYARTTGKERTQDADPFWGEPFEFNNLQDVALVTIRLYRDAADRKRRRKSREPLGEVQLAAQDIRSPLERWFPLTPTPQSQQPQQHRHLQQQPPSAAAAAPSLLPSLRIRAHFHSVDVLPLRCYRGLRELAMQQPLALTAALEPRLQLRAKEDLAARLVSVAHALGRGERLLADLVIAELGRTSSASDAMLLRGNSVATKAVEFFLKLTGAAYLRAVLSEPLSTLLRQQPPNCEVDPQLVGSADQLAVNQRNLISLVELFWSSIRSSADLVPPEVARLFALIRQRLADVGRPDLGDTLVSASLFLRLICPAILGPSLFGLCQELPGSRATRALTLVAKAIQNLANGGAQFGAKEPHMQFLNRLLDHQGPSMRLFLRAASRPPPRTSAAAPAVAIDLGYELAQLHSLLSSCLATIDKPEPILVSAASELAIVGAAVSGDADDPWVYSNVSDSPGSPPNHSQQKPQTAATLNDEWKRVLDEAQSFTTGSSGYQSFTTGPGASANVSADSPVQFYNPTYQKAVSAAAAAADDLLLRASSSSDLASSVASLEPGPPPPPTPPPPLLPLQTDVRLKSRSLGPSSGTSPGPGTADFAGGRVRMGIRARQHPQQPTLAAAASALPRKPIDYETELQKLHRELTETRRRLQASEARLRSNEGEKAQLMAQFQQHHQRQRQQQQLHQMSRSSTDAADQMQEIMQRLQCLECSLQRHSAAGSPVTQGGSCLRGD